MDWKVGEGAVSFPSPVSGAFLLAKSQLHHPRTHTFAVASVEDEEAGEEHELARIQHENATLKVQRNPRCVRIVLSVVILSR